MRVAYLILYLSFFTGCNTNDNEKESTRLTNESKTFLQNNKFDEAQIVIEKAIRLDPNNYAAYNNRAYLKIKQNKPSEDVLADLKKALEIKPNYEIALYSLANYYFEIKDYDKTIQNVNVYLKYAATENFDTKLKEHIYGISAESKYMKKDFDNAIIDIKAALALDSTYAAAHKILGDCYFYKNSVELAIKEFTIAIGLDSNYYQSYLARARSYESSKIPALLNLAEQDYRSAFKINPAAEDIYETNSPLFKKIKQTK